MRIHRIIPLVLALGVSSCDDSGPTADGKLVVATATQGEAPDPDGYLLTVDGGDTLALDPTGVAELDVRAGRHRLGLLGVAAHCSVVPGISVEVEVAPRGTTPVGFVIDCPATGIRVTTTTTGLDIDPSGYRITVSTAHSRGIRANGTVLIGLAPGEWTVAVADLAPNCAIEGAHSRTVAVVANEVVGLEFLVLCTAASGVIGVSVHAAGVDIEGGYEATVDGTHHRVHLGQRSYLTGITLGDHIVALIPPANCSVQTDPQSILLSAGGLVRDTAEVSFSVTCVTRQGNLQISAQTTGTPPAHDYSVWLCDPGFYCRFYPYLLGALDPNGWLSADVQPGSYEIWLDDVPATCGVQGPSAFTIEERDTLHLEYSVSCP